MKPIGPYSLWVKGISNAVPYHFSGVIGLDPTTGALSPGGLKNEVHQAFKNLDEVLAQTPVKKTDIVKTTVFLTTMQHFSEMNEIYAQYFGEHKPARSCVAVSELPKGCLFEIEVFETNFLRILKLELQINYK